MYVTAISKDSLYQITLPEKVKGQYWLYSSSDKKNKIVSIEGVNNSWIIKSNSNYRVVDSQNKIKKNVILNEMQLVLLKNKEGSKIFVFCEPVTDDRKHFDKYIFKDSIQLNIGRSKKCELYYANRTVSSSHALLKYENDRWYIKDLNSTNGTFINGKRVDQCYLKYGDVVNIMGLKIVVGKNFVAVNNPDSMLTVSTKLSPFIAQPHDNDKRIPSENDELFFYRSPRFKRNIKTLELNVDSPPESPVADEVPVILVVGTSAAMGMMSVVMICNAVLTNNYMSLAMGVCMLISTVLFPVITKNFEKNRRFKKEKLRQKKYGEYLERIAVEIDEAAEEQKQILHENIHTISECERRIVNIKRNLWDRSPGQDDFLDIRVGIGEIELSSDIKYDDKTFTLQEDNLQDELIMLCKKKKLLSDVPISFSIYQNYISGVIGDKNTVNEFAKSVVIQLASQYSYDEVKFVFLYSEEEEHNFDFVKWLPHVWSDDNKFRFIAKNNNELKEVSAYFEKQIEQHPETNNDITLSNYYVVFSLNKDLALRSDLLKSIYSKGSNIGVSVIAFYESIHLLPKECSLVVELNDISGRLYNRNDISGKVIEFMPDIKLNSNPDSLSKRLSNIYLDTVNANYKFPSMITFMNLHEVGKVDHLNLLTRWGSNDPTKSLAAPVGVNTLGDVFMLDIHEKFHGPHGLIAGMTGSGKSEFIITYILSLAINYHPNEVAFVLIDYKGGGMAKSFEDLPHTVGIITNLDGAAINRSLVSIESELKRRQHIFSKASKKINVSNIDIYKYQQLYREGVVDEPLPHLLIISDEFAELKAQRPEFMTQLVSAARIGRSLGVHLILATQKPSGVVDDQIWSNSRFRVCLKVQERADSQDMLKRPDAAELQDTGRFYLQVGYNELFEMGQSAWSGAPYYPSDTVEIKKDESISVIDTNAHVIRSLANKEKKYIIKNPNKQVDEIAAYINNTAKEVGIHARRLWLEPIPSHIYVDELIDKYSIKSDDFILNPCIGEYDNPANQSQHALYAPLSTEGNIIVYGSAGSGKTTFCNALIYSLLHSYSPDEVNLYLLDYASETMRAFKGAPHVGDVIFADDEEKMLNLFKYLNKEIARRRKLFSEYGGDYRSYINSSGDFLPSIVVVIHNFAAFMELYEEKEDDMLFVSREGLKYGIYMILTASATNGVKFRLAQNFNQHYCLQLNDITEYSNVVGRTEGMLPSKHKGRGLVKLEKLYEFQVAYITRDSNIITFIEHDCAILDDKWNGNKAAPINVLPEYVNINYVKEYIEDSNLAKFPIGVDVSSLKICNYDFSHNYINCVASESMESSSLIYSIASLIDEFYDIDTWFFEPSFSDDVDFKSVKYYNNMSDCEKYIDELFNIVLERNNETKDALRNRRKVKSYKNILVLINSVTTLSKILTDKGKESLSLILEKGASNLNINFIIADSSSGFSSLIYEIWYKENTSSMFGIWCGHGFKDQYQFKISNLTRDINRPVDDQFGFAITNGRCQKIKILKTVTEGEL